MKTEGSAPNQTPLWLRRALWSGVVTLALIGVAAAIGRAVFLDDLATRGEPFRQLALSALDRTDPFQAERVGELRRFDGSFAAHPLITLLHVLPGGLLLTLAPLQFSRGIRTRYIRFHRWSGRVVMLATLAVVFSGLYFGLLMPYGGAGEAVAAVLAGGFGLAAMGRAFFAIRRRQIARHREWMMRAFAIAIGIAMIRVVSFVLDMALSPAGFRSPEIFVLSLWSGWVITLGAAELWIRYTRFSSQVASSRVASGLVAE